jgi:hypothetical protein
MRNLEYGTVNGVSGAILLPDEFIDPCTNKVYSYSSPWFEEVMLHNGCSVLPVIEVQ